jgi:uncharacterized protein (DUF2235 family)
MTAICFEAKRPKRQLLVCCDGTNNNLTGQDRDTNVVKLVQLITGCETDPNRVVFYDPGVGNPGQLPGATFPEQIKGKLVRWGGLASGEGIYENMAECYLFLMRHYQPEDEIFIFGFSRGAFTARSVAGLVNMFGVLQPQMETMVSTLIQVYFANSQKVTKAANLKNEKSPLVKISDQTRQLFAIASKQKAEIQFVGVWDTVDSVGVWPFNTKMKAVPTIVDKRFLNVRHAVALDEHRAQFKPRLYVDNNGKCQTSSKKEATIKQLWFRGSHCDVGGGYQNTETVLSNYALEWMVSQAVDCGLALKFNSRPLNTEPLVRAAWLAQQPQIARERLHSELYVSCLWALTGMTVRRCDAVRVDGEDTDRPLVPEAHPSVAASKLAFPADTVWHKRAVPPALYVGLLVGCTAYLASGWLLLGEALPTTLAAATLYAWHCIVVNAQFAWLQLTWLFQAGPHAFSELMSPTHLRGLVWLDFLFIAAYAYVLSWFAVKAFAKKAAFRLVAAPPKRRLNMLGWALVLMVVADVVENGLTLVAFGLYDSAYCGIAKAVGIAMSVASLCKFVGFAGVIALLWPGKKAQ